MFFQEIERRKWKAQLKGFNNNGKINSILSFRGIAKYEDKKFEKLGSLRFLYKITKHPNLCTLIKILKFKDVCFKYESSILLIKFLESLPNLDFLDIDISVSSIIYEMFFPFLSLHFTKRKKQINFKIYDLKRRAFEMREEKLEKVYFAVSLVVRNCKNSFISHLQANVFKTTKKYFYIALERSEVKGELGSAFKSESCSYLEILVAQKIKVCRYQKIKIW